MAAPDRSSAEGHDDPAVQERIDLMMQEARELFFAASDFLASQTEFRVVADVSFDVLQSDGRLLEFGDRRETTIRRPDRARIEVERRSGEKRSVFFDGSIVSVELPEHAAYARIPLPGTYYAAFDHLADELDAPITLAALFSENLAARIADEIESGYSVGTAVVDGRVCEHLAFRMPGSDVQIWIEKGDRPLLARVVITYKLEEGNPQFRATLRDWAFDLDSPDDFFHFEPKDGSEELKVESFLNTNLDANDEGGPR